MPRETAQTAQPLSIAERKANLAAMVERGEISAEHAALIDFREPTEQERAYAETLAPRARQILAGDRQKIA